MILKSISILNFKNIEQADLTLSPKLNCFVGNNGVGKTNLLDAIYYLSFCRSTFSQSNQHVLRHGQDTMMIQGVYSTEDNETLNITCGLKNGRRKSFRKNGKEYRRISEHIGLIPLVMVSPDDIEFVQGTSEFRRKFLDTTISQYSPLYLQELIRYNQLLLQRNVWLKSENQPNEELMNIYDLQLASAGQKIYEQRKNFINSFKETFRSIYAQVGNTNEIVDLNYKSHLDEDSLINLLHSHHQKDFIVGHTLKGTHRDDIEMMLNGHSIRYEGSQGQIKSYITALRLAQYIYLKNTIKTRSPLLLLDDIFDKLDSKRVENIIHVVSNNEYGQIFITSTSDTTLKEIIKLSTNDYRFFIVKDGTYEAY